MHLKFLAFEERAEGPKMGIIFCTYFYY